MITAVLAVAVGAVAVLTNVGIAFAAGVVWYAVTERASGERSGTESS
ncbi:hypothetical protein [Natronomonas sp.]|nr:hypothetical protein [Natronomonas sp.]